MQSSGAQKARETETTVEQNVEIVGFATWLQRQISELQGELAQIYGEVAHNYLQESAQGMSLVDQSALRELVGTLTMLVTGLEEELAAAVETAKVC